MVYESINFHVTTINRLELDYQPKICRVSRQKTNWLKRRWIRLIQTREPECRSRKTKGNESGWSLIVVVFNRELECAQNKSVFELDYMKTVLKTYNFKRI